MLPSRFQGAGRAQGEQLMRSSFSKQWSHSQAQVGRDLWRSPSSNPPTVRPFSKLQPNYNYTCSSEWERQFPMQKSSTLIQSKYKEHKDILLQIQLLPLCRGTAPKDFKCNVLLIELCHPQASNTEIIKSASSQAQ